MLPICPFALAFTQLLTQNIYPMVANSILLRIADSLESISKSLETIAKVQTQTSDDLRGEQSEYFHKMRDETIVHFSEVNGEAAFNEQDFVSFAYRDCNQRVSLATCKRWLQEAVAIEFIFIVGKNSYSFFPPIGSEYSLTRV